MDSEEAFAALHRAVPPVSGYRMTLLCAHGTCKRLKSWIPSPLQTLWGHELIHEKASPLLNAPPGNREGRSSCLGSSLWQWEQVAVSSPMWDVDGIPMVLHKTGLTKAPSHSHHNPEPLPLGKGN